MSMDEDAMFKALLKKKPQQQAQAPVTKEVKETVPAARPVSTSKNSEDAMFKALLRNRPQQQSVPSVQRPPVRTETAQHAPAPPPVTYEEPEPVKETKSEPTVNTMQADLAEESIKNLTASVDRIYGLLKSTIVPVLILILVVGVSLLIKLNK